jgi:hypothetical protein
MLSFKGYLACQVSPLVAQRHCHHSQPWTSIAGTRAPGGGLAQLPRQTRWPCSSRTCSLVSFSETSNPTYWPMAALLGCFLCSSRFYQTWHRWGAAASDLLLLCGRKRAGERRPSDYSINGQWAGHGRSPNLLTYPVLVPAAVVGMPFPQAAPGRRSRCTERIREDRRPAPVEAGLAPRGR